MAGSYNKVTLIGNVGADPQARDVGQSRVVSFSVATSEGKEDHKKTTWFRCNAWDKVGVIVEQYVRKGAYVYVEGTLSENEYTDRTSNETRKSLEVRVREFKMLDKAETSSEERHADSSEKEAVDFDKIPF